MTLIGVKSKYGSRRGTCAGLIKVNNTQYIEIYTSLYWSIDLVRFQIWAYDNAIKNIAVYHSIPMEKSYTI